jgi:hypothetical protein
LVIASQIQFGWQKAEEQFLVGVVIDKRYVQYPAVAALGAGDNVDLALQKFYFSLCILTHINGVLHLSAVFAPAERASYSGDLCLP